MTGDQAQVDLIPGYVDVFYERELPTEKIDEGYDIVVDAGGSQSSLQYCVDTVVPRGTILESGCMTKALMFDVSHLVKKEVIMVTQLGYVPKDFIWAIDVVRAHNNELRRVITHRFRLSEYEQAKEVLLTKKHGKVIFDLTLPLKD